MRSLIHTSHRLHTAAAETAGEYEEVIYRRQLMCWSIALFAISFWFASLFFQFQTSNWHSAGPREHPSFFIAPPSEWEVVRKRVEAKRLARAAAQRTTAQRTTAQRSAASLRLVAQRTD